MFRRYVKEKLQDGACIAHEFAYGVVYMSRANPLNEVLVTATTCRHPKLHFKAELA